MLDKVQDAFDEYRYYLTDASDLISNALSKLKDIVRERARNGI